MKYSDRELEQADDYLGMSSEEQMEQCGMQQPRGKSPVYKINRYTTPFVFESGGIVMKEDDSNCEVCLSPNVSALEAEIERLKEAIDILRYKLECKDNN